MNHINKDPPPAISNKSDSVLYFRSWIDVLARTCFVGIFIIENIFHVLNFEAEIEGLVAPAFAPLPREIAVCLHITHVVLGIAGATFVLISGWDTAGRTALHKGCRMMLIFMTTITWTWWINRGGVPYWDVEAGAEKRNRLVHILKNISIFGANMTLQRIAQYDQETNQGTVSWLEGLVTSIRVWSFTTSFTPILITFAVLKARYGFELPGYLDCIALLVAMFCVQAVGNLTNSYADFKSGVDSVSQAGGDRTLVDKLVSQRALTVLIGIFGTLWTIFFGWSLTVTQLNATMIGCGIVGSALTLLYTMGPAPLKYIGLGEVTIWMCFGPLIVAYASSFLVQQCPVELLLITAPCALFTVAILHANNLRDMRADERAGITTIALKLGEKWSIRYYDALLWGSHLGAVALAYQLQCYGLLVSLVVLPRTMWLQWRVRFPDLVWRKTIDEETAKTQLYFGLTTAIGIVCMPDSTVFPLGFVAGGLVTGILILFG